MAAGWTLDLFRGTQTRDHGDIEVAIPAANFPEIRDRFPGCAFDAVSSGRIWEEASPDVLAATHQTWLHDRATGNDPGAVAVGCGVLAEPGRGHHAIVDLQGHHVVGDPDCYSCTSLGREVRETSTKSSTNGSRLRQTEPDVCGRYIGSELR